MVQVWWFNDDGLDQRKPHKKDDDLIDLAKLKELTGVSYWKVS